MGDDERTSRQTIERSLQAALQHVDELTANEKLLQERLDSSMACEERIQRLNTELETELGQHEGKLLAVQEALELARARHIEELSETTRRMVNDHATEIHTLETELSHTQTSRRTEQVQHQEALNELEELSKSHESLMATSEATVAELASVKRE